MVGKTIEGKDAVVPTRDERTVGVDIYDWEPKNDRFEHIDSRIEIEDDELREACGDVDVKLSVWDFAGQHVYHATHDSSFRTCDVCIGMGYGSKKTSHAATKRNSHHRRIRCFQAVRFF